MQLPTMERLGVVAIIIAVCISTPLAGATPVGWDFAITLTTKVLFLDNNWKTVDSAAHEYDKLSGLAFDEAEEVLYFNDQQHKNSSIFSLRRDANARAHLIEGFVQRTDNESVAGLSYDPLNRNLFWVDDWQKKIFFASIDNQMLGSPKMFLNLSAEGSKPESIAVDFCRRQLYWTNRKNGQATVERIELSGKNRQTIISEDVTMPRSIVVDQLTDRIFWLDRSGIFMSVESANLDGSDRQTVIKDNYQDPVQLAITEDTIYWTDKADNSVWSYPKPIFTKQNTIPAMHTPKVQRVANYTEVIHGIVARTDFYPHLIKDEHCASVVRKVKQRVLEVANRSTSTMNPVEKRVAFLEQEHCLNGGTLDPTGRYCVCQTGYEGHRCDESVCHNYCMHGTCRISDTGYAKCACQPDFHGERCEYKCTDHCLNGGRCLVDSDSGKLSCECTEDFNGTRCEYNSTTACALTCLQQRINPEIVLPESCLNICEGLTNSNGTSVAAFRQESKCGEPTDKSDVLIIVIVGVVVSLSLVAIIVHGVRRIYKPKRPHIKKTFVIRKQPRHNSSSDTPLTNRPLAAEQCEITIENCCNMNICETPCFDPKMVEQQFSRSKKSPCIKDDKKILIREMEEDFSS